MPHDKTWTMNCVLVGAKTMEFLLEGNESRARVELRQLTSALQPEDINYLIARLKEE